MRERANGERYRSPLPAAGPGPEILLQRVPDGKRGKNRVHLDPAHPATWSRKRGGCWPWGHAERPASPW